MTTIKEKFQPVAISGVSIVQINKETHQWALVEITNNRVTRQIYFGFLPEVMRRYNVLYCGYRDKVVEE